MDWSWDLLTNDEKTLLRRMAVFAGPFPLEAAETICDVQPTLELLGSLLAKSLVTMDESADVTRHRLLETVRAYAQARLVEAGEAADTRDAHRDWCLARTEAVPLDALLESGGTMATFVADHANLRAAMDWSAGQGRSDLVARQVLPISMAWTHSTALIDEASRWLRRVAESPQLETSVRADALALFAFVGGMASGDRALQRKYAELSLELDRSDRPFLADALMLLSRTNDAVEAAVRAGRPSFARLARAYAACTASRPTYQAVSGLWRRSRRNSTLPRTAGTGALPTKGSW